MLMQKDKKVKKFAALRRGFCKFSVSTDFGQKMLRFFGGEVKRKQKERAGRGRRSRNAGEARVPRAPQGGAGRRTKFGGGSAAVWQQPALRRKTPLLAGRKCGKTFWKKEKLFVDKFRGI